MAQQISQKSDRVKSVQPVNPNKSSSGPVTSLSVPGNGRKWGLWLIIVLVAIAAAIASYYWIVR